MKQTWKGRAQKQVAILAHNLLVPMVCRSGKNSIGTNNVKQCYAFHWYQWCVTVWTIALVQIMFISLMHFIDTNGVSQYDAFH